MGSALQVIAVIDALIGLAIRLKKVADQLAGDEPIPTIDEIVEKQKKLDAELEAANEAKGA